MEVSERKRFDGVRDAWSGFRHLLVTEHSRIPHMIVVAIFASALILLTAFVPHLRRLLERP